MKKALFVLLAMAIFISGYLLGNFVPIPNRFLPTISSNPVLQHTISPSFNPTSDPTTEPSVIPTETPTPEPAFDPSSIATIKKTGKGDDVIKITVKTPWFYRCTATHTGKSNFAIKSTIGNNKILDVNEIGKFTGSFPLVLFDATTVTLEITADGPWTITLVPLLYGNVTEMTGTGMYVSNLFPVEDGKIFQFTHSGKSNFAVYIVTTDGQDLLINEIGKYNGKKLVDMAADGFGFWVIHADGKWTIKKSE